MCVITDELYAMLCSSFYATISTVEFLSHSPSRALSLSQHGPNSTGVCCWPIPPVSLIRDHSLYHRHRSSTHLRPRTIVNRTLLVVCVHGTQIVCCCILHHLQHRHHSEGERKRERETERDRSGKKLHRKVCSIKKRTKFQPTSLGWLLCTVGRSVDGEKLPNKFPTLADTNTNGTGLPSSTVLAGWLCSDAFATTSSLLGLPRTDARVRECMRHGLTKRTGIWIVALGRVTGATRRVVGGRVPVRLICVRKV